MNLKNGIIQDKEINGVKVFIDLIPTSNETSRPQYEMDPTFITIHNVGNPGSTAEQNSKFVDKTEKYLSWHLTIGKGVLYQELPFNESGWHAGDGSNGDGNRKSIGIEICDNDESRETAIKIVPVLMKYFNISINNVFPHQHWSGKNCPYLILPMWDEFIDDIVEGTVGVNGLHMIMSKGIARVNQMVEATLNSNVSPKINCDIEELAQIFIEECEIEGVNHDYAWAQSLHETGYFAFNGDANWEWNNYAGLGVTGAIGEDGIPLGNKFETPRKGVRAQVQHLKAYASNKPLEGKLVDQRFDLVTRGSAPYVEWLGKDDNPNGTGWAWPGAGYGARVLEKVESMYNIIPTTYPDPAEPIPASEFKEVYHTKEAGTYKIIFRADQGLYVKK